LFLKSKEKSNDLESELFLKSKENISKFFNEEFDLIKTLIEDKDLVDFFDNTVKDLLLNIIYLIINNHTNDINKREKENKQKETELQNSFEDFDSLNEFSDDKYINVNGICYPKIDKCFLGEKLKNLIIVCMYELVKPYENISLRSVACESYVYSDYDYILEIMYYFKNCNFCMESFCREHFNYIFWEYIIHTIIKVRQDILKDII